MTRILYSASRYRWAVNLFSLQDLAASAIFRCRVLTVTLLIADSSSAFLAARPEWTLSGARLPCGNGVGAIAVRQTPFRWLDGVWETETQVTGASIESRVPTRVVLRVSPETLRRWKEVGINPFLEACAQLSEHLRLHARHGHLTSLTLL